MQSQWSWRHLVLGIVISSAAAATAPAAQVGSWAFNGSLAGGVGPTGTYYDNALASAATYTVGRDGAVGGALDIAGGNEQYASIDLSSLGISTSNLTVAGWFKTEATAADWSSWFGMDAYKLRVEYRDPALPSEASPSRPQSFSEFEPPFTDAENEQGKIIGAAAPAMNDGQWRHIALTLSTVDNLAALYVDGAIVGSSEWIWSGDVNTLHIGNSFGWKIMSTTAAIDDVGVWNEALSASAVASLAATAVVPEPMGMSFLALGGLALLRRRRRADARS
jgi:MYXO-CTERM domain-containing protein